MMGFVGHRIYSQNISITSFTIHNNFLHTFPQFLYFNIVWPGSDQKFKRSMTLKLVIFIQKNSFNINSDVHGIHKIVFYHTFGSQRSRKEGKEEKVFFFVFHIPNDSFPTQHNNRDSHKYMNNRFFVSIVFNLICLLFLALPYFTTVSENFATNNNKILW